MDSLISRWEDYKKLIENQLHHYLDELNTTPDILKKAMEYSLFAGGKRFRPVLSLLINDSLKGETSSLLPAACALEMIHTYSLIHDDLPAMDDDDFRRGKPSSHKQFGEANAILAGDALLTYAFELISTHSKDATKSVEYIKILAAAAGPQGMIAGQVIDLITQKSDDSTNTQQILEYIHLNKTAKMIIASAQLALTNHPPLEPVAHSILNYAQNIGLAFQVQDDVLDYTGDQKSLGKSIHKDKKQNKLTYVSLFGIEKSKQLLADLILQAKQSLHPDLQSKILIELAEYLEQRNH